jgi:hypothetical protein
MYKDDDSQLPTSDYCDEADEEVKNNFDDDDVDNLDDGEAEGMPRR